MIKPLKNRIFVKADEKKEETKSGLIIESKNQEKQRFGEVLYTGEEITQFKPGDIVYFISGLAYREVKVLDKDYLVCTEEDIACKLK